MRGQVNGNWKQTPGVVRGTTPIDATPSEGAPGPNAGPRDYDRVSPDRDWKATSDAYQAAEDRALLDTNPSEGSSELRHFREVEAMCYDRDWQSTRAPPATTPLDVTPSEGSTALRHPRDIAVGGWEASGKAAIATIAPDATPSEGAAGPRQGPRDYDSVPGAFDAPVKGDGAGPAIDTTPSVGSIALSYARAYEGNTRVAVDGTGLAPLAANTEPSTGSLTLTNARYYDRMPYDTDWARSGASDGMRALPAETAPLSKDDATQLESRLDRFRTLSHRGSEDWKDVRRLGLEELPFDSTPSSGSDALRNPRDFDRPAEEWQWDAQGNAIEPLPLWGEPGTGSVATKPPREFDRMPYDRDWKITKPATILTPLAPDVVPTPFSQNLRELDRMDPSVDWKTATHVDNNPRTPEHLDREAYVDPCKRMEQYYSRGKSDPTKKHGRSPTRSRKSMQTPPPPATTPKPSSSKKNTPTQKSASPRITPHRAERKLSPTAQSVRGAYMSPTMAAFMHGEALKAQRKNKSGTRSSKSSPQSNNVQSVATQASPL